MISITNVTKRYEGALALRDLTIEVEKGETVIVTGPNGAGKTTLLRIICGLTNPTSGTVTLNGAPPKSSRLFVGYAGNASFLYPFLTVRENLEFFARLYGSPAERVDHLLELFRIRHKRGSLARNLSAGETQRASLARALIHDPDVFLADEPLAALDAEGEEALPDLIRRPGRTSVIVTHDMEFAKKVEGAVVHLQNGILIS